MGSCLEAGLLRKSRLTYGKVYHSYRMRMVVAKQQPNGGTRLTNLKQLIHLSTNGYIRYRTDRVQRV